MRYNVVPNLLEIKLEELNPVGHIYGPFVDKYGFRYVEVLIQNVFGNLIERKIIPYRRYVREYEEGQHRYPKNFNIPKAKIKPLEPYKTNCLNCGVQITTTPRGPKYCNHNCNAQYRKRDRNNLIFTDQIVTKIKDDKEQYYIVVDLKRDKRDHRFVNAKDCTVQLKDDENGIVRFYLHYPLEKSVRIRLAKDYKKLFWITETGLLISRRTKIVLSQRLSKSGYWTHASYIGGRNGQTICIKVHRLIASAFVPNPENKPFVNHIDGVKTNNHWTNLEWVTNQENIQHAISLGLIDSNQNSGQNAYQASLTNEQASQMREMKRNGVSTKKIIHHFNSTRNIVKKVLAGKSYRTDLLKNSQPHIH